MVNGKFYNIVRLFCLFTFFLAYFEEPSLLEAPWDSLRYHLCNTSQITDTLFVYRKKKANGVNRPFAASHSCGAKPPCWRATVVLGHDKQKAYIILNDNFLCLSCPSVTFALQHGGFVPQLATKGL